MGKIKFTHTYENIISVENLLIAWREFVKGKKNRKDVQEFNVRLSENIFDLHLELADKTYIHGPYKAFKINDPKPRNIHKATVRDRLLHHAIYRVLYPFFDRTFIADSYSCRICKGTHKSLARFEFYSRKASINRTKTVWVLKCDIRKFFASVDQKVLLTILRQYISNDDVIWLLERIITSFNSGVPGVGLPLGNLTSQLFVNIFMNQFDQYVKHTLLQKYYIRYADDFVIIHHDHELLLGLLHMIDYFLLSNLELSLHSKKIQIKTISSGIDFLGWIHFSDHRILRTSTKRRMLKRLMKSHSPETRVSYIGLLKYGNTFKIRNRINQIITPTS